MKNEYHEKKLFELLKRGKFNQKGCLEWTSALDEDGYGIVSFSDGAPRKSWKVHRLIFFLLKDSFDKNKLVCHACDNRKCFNLNHLFLGTPKDNALDRKEKNRGWDQRGENNPSNILSEKIVLHIRKMYSEGHRVRDIVQFYGICQPTISKIVHRKRWTHI